MKKNVLILLCVVSAVLFFSCADLFTTSLAGKPSSDNLTKKLDKLSTDKIASMFTNPQQPLSSSEAKAALDSLSRKDANEIKNLSSDQKNGVLNAAGSAIISDPGKILGGLDLENIGSMDETAGKTIFESVINSVDKDVNTGAVSVLLSDPETVSKAAPEAVLIATASVLGSLTANSDKSFEEISKGLTDSMSGGNTNPETIAQALADTLSTPGTTPTAEMNAVANALAMMTGASVGGQTMDTSKLPFKFPF